MISRLFSTKRVSALSVFQNSCYHKIDFKIAETDLVNHAVHKFAAFNIGCLAVTNPEQKVVGVLSERDYISKVSVFGKDDKALQVKDICSYSQIVVATPTDSVEQCMKKMLVRDIRHLLVMDNSECVGMISIRDLIKEVVRDKNRTIARLTDFKTGKGGVFGSE